MAKAKQMAKHPTPDNKSGKGMLKAQIEADISIHSQCPDMRKESGSLG